MNDLELQTKLTREMSSKDYCHQRIFSCIPLLWTLYGNYMSETKNYNFSSVLLEIIKDWNNERNNEILEYFNSLKCPLAIAELNIFYELICKIYDNYYNNNFVDIDSLKKIQIITLDNYKDISSLCHIFVKDDNRSKILARLTTLKKKTNKFFNGVINIHKFIEKEIKPQKQFLDVFIQRLNLFEKNQFCIFMLCYDLKKTNKSIFIKDNNTLKDPFLI